MKIPDFRKLGLSIFSSKHLLIYNKKMGNGQVLFMLLIFLQLSTFQYCRTVIPMQVFHSL